MDDFKLNKSIAEALGIYRQEGQYILDYIGNWNDLMPLVDIYNITAIYLEREEWSCNTSSFDDNGNTTVSNYAVNDDLQRAYAECLLKLLRSKNA